LVLSRGLLDDHDVGVRLQLPFSALSLLRLPLARRSLGGKFGEAGCLVLFCSFF